MTTITQTQTQYDSTEYNRELEKNANSPSKFASLQNWRSYPQPTMPQLIYPELSYAIQGTIYDVYNTLCYLEIKEEHWEKALAIALTEKGLTVQQQVEYKLHYKDYPVGSFFTDILVEEKILLELILKTGTK